MKPAIEPTVETAEEQRPIISFTRVIEGAVGTGSFGGWGPKVAGSSSLLNNWN